MEWSIPHVVDQLAAAAIAGIEEAIVERNSLMHLSDKPALISQYNMEMFIILKFLDIIIVPNLGRLDLRYKECPSLYLIYD